MFCDFLSSFDDIYQRLRNYRFLIIVFLNNCDDAAVDNRKKFNKIFEKFLKEWWSWLMIERQKCVAHLCFFNYLSCIFFRSLILFSKLHNKLISHLFYIDHRRSLHQQWHLLQTNHHHSFHHLLFLLRIDHFLFLHFSVYLQHRRLQHHQVEEFAEVLIKLFLYIAATILFSFFIFRLLVSVLDAHRRFFVHVFVIFDWQTLKNCKKYITCFKNETEMWSHIYSCFWIIEAIIHFVLIKKLFFTSFISHSSTTKNWKLLLTWK